MWGLPTEIVEATAFHHMPRLVSSGDRRLLAVLHVADALVQGKGDDIDLEFIEAAGLAAELPEWRKVAEDVATPARMTAMTQPKPRVLCVDDEPLILEGLSLHLHRHYSVVTATSGAQALDICGRRSAFPSSCATCACPAWMAPRS